MHDRTHSCRNIAVDHAGACCRIASALAASVTAAALFDVQQTCATSALARRARLALDVTELLVSRTKSVRPSRDVQSFLRSAAHAAAPANFRHVGGKLLP